MDKQLWQMYLRAPWYWQLFLPGLMLLKVMAILYFDSAGVYWTSHDGWNL